jgi:hypothetical protein
MTDISDSYSHTYDYEYTVDMSLSAFAMFYRETSKEWAK